MVSPISRCGYEWDNIPSAPLAVGGRYVDSLVDMVVRMWARAATLACAQTQIWIVKLVGGGEHGISGNR